tara:strand:- start:50761 stop:51081 length:321 start_codon:yes stop_codon:yes gene_type:complete
MLAVVLSLASSALPQGAPPAVKPEAATSELATSELVTPERATSELATPLDATSFAAWRDHIAPLAEENRWLQIDWQDSIAAGMQAASKQQRPMLLWLMNGHPLGCT